MARIDSKYLDMSFISVIRAPPPHSSQNCPVLLTNSADLDQTAPQEQSDLGLHCVLREHCYNILSNYSMICCSKSSAVSSALFSFTREDNGTAWNSLEVNSFCS